MPETLTKLRPDRDLQCYFERPSAIAAMSEASPSGFKVSGTWRQQFDWAVIEWNRENVFEHPLFRNLPDGNLSGITLTYEETRTNCIAVDSDLYPTVDWPSLRIWTRDDGVDDFFKVKLFDPMRATPIEGGYVAAGAEFELTGTLTVDDYAGISCLDEHFTYQITGADTLASVAQAIADAVNSISTRLTATRIGNKVRLEMRDPTTGANGNRWGAYAFVAGAGPESWSPWFSDFSGGQSPTKWRFTLNFGSLVAMDGRTVPASQIRKMRWTYAAEQQKGQYVRSEFLVAVSNWTVSGTGLNYQVASAASRRIEDDAKEVQYTGTWGSDRNNYSGGSIRYSTNPGDTVTINYRAAGAHTIYLGTRYSFNSGSCSVLLDGVALGPVNLLIGGEDSLARVKLAESGAGTHTVVITHTGAGGTYVYFDFLEIAVPATETPDLPEQATVTLATDWDTDHSIALPAERTAWMIYSLGYRGRANHYVGAIWFYELWRQGHVYASATITFSGTPVFSAVTTVTVGVTGVAGSAVTHLNRIGDTAETIAKAFEIEFNRGYTAIRAEASGRVLTIYARQMGIAGNDNTIAASTGGSGFTATVSNGNLAGGTNGEWRTDLTAMPRLNRAVRDWTRAYFTALRGYGIEGAAAFSTEIRDGDPSVAAGIAQRYPNGDPVLVNTPAVQTNFSPTSIAFWQDVYLGMAAVMVEAGVVPYLQLGEVQWWYFPKDGVGMTFYDEYTKARFAAEFGHPIQTILSQSADPSLYPEEMDLLPRLIGEYTASVMSYVKSVYPECKFEVLYPTDVNNTPLNRLVNYPNSEWTPAKLDCLKTESFGFTFLRNLELSAITVEFGAAKSFPRSKRSFLVGIGDAWSPWKKEMEMARGQNLESVVLFALDQYCLVGYRTPLASLARRCGFQG